MLFIDPSLDNGYIFTNFSSPASVLSSMSSPIASIVIDSYNHERFLEQAITSALEQTVDRKDLEVIVVDDGSTDATVACAQKFGSDITLIRKENGGQGSTFNAGFAAAKGKYIILCDADDYLLPERAERVIQEFERYPDLAIVLNSRNIIGPGLDEKEKFKEFHNLALSYETVGLLVDAGYGTSRTSMRREAVEKILPIPETHLFSADVYLMSLLWHGTMSCLDEVLTVYRVHDSNNFHTGNPEKQQQRGDSVRVNATALREHIEKLPNYDHQLAKDYLVYFDLYEKESYYSALLALGKAKRKDLLEVEMLKFRCYRRTWGLFEKLYKALRLLALLLFSPATTKNFRDRWAAIRRSR